jgi:hypothetical protein
MSKKLTLLPVDTQADLEDLCIRLRAELEDGRLVGLVAIPMYRRGHHRQYTLAMAGWASRNPTYTAGAVATCATLINQIALTEAGVI